MYIFKDYLNYLYLYYTRLKKCSVSFADYLKHRVRLFVLSIHLAPHFQDGYNNNDDDGGNDDDDNNN